MIPALLAQIGLPLLMKAVSAGLKWIGNPASDAAAAALDEVGSQVRGGTITQEQIAESNRHLERLSELETEESVTALRQINMTMRVEAASQDKYVRRWRPTFGYAVALTWTVQMSGLTFAIVATPEYAGEIVAAMVNLSVIWGIALSVLGVAVHQRSKDKAVAAGKAAGPGFLSDLMRKLGS